MLFNHGTETDPADWLLQTYFAYAPVNKTVSLDFFVLNEHFTAIKCAIT